MTVSPQAKVEELLFGGALTRGIPGLYGLTGDSMPFIVTTSEMDWHSTATRTSRRVVPFAFKLVDFWTRLVTAPVGATGTFRLGTSTSVSLFFNSGTLSFNSNSPVLVGTTGFIRRTTATNFKTANALLGVAGQLVQMQTVRKGAGAAFSTKGVVIGLWCVVPR